MLLSYLNIGSKIKLYEKAADTDAKVKEKSKNVRNV